MAFEFRTTLNIFNINIIKIDIYISLYLYLYLFLQINNMIEQINEYINSENISSPFVLKRLKRESKDFLEKFESLSVKNNNGKYEIYLTDKSNYKYNNYCFILDNNYPFREPKLLINNIEYKKFLMNGTIKYRDIFTKMSGRKCLCCDNILSNERWSPAITLVKIVDEINIFRGYKKNILYKIMIDKIKNKYLLDDIDVESWLF